MALSNITLFHGDIPADLNFGSSVAIDTETLGLSLVRDRLCLCQLSSGDGKAYLVQFAPDQYAAPNLKKMLGRSEGFEDFPLWPLRFGDAQTLSGRYAKTRLLHEDRFYFGAYLHG